MMEGTSLHRHLLHAAQLIAAVVVGYALAALLGLPERFWVVMTVLIVMRVDRGTTMDAGVERVVGTVVGALLGLLGVGLGADSGHLGGVALVIVSLLAGGSALWPALRSGAVAALIVLAAQHLPDSTPTQAAAYRLVQILLGVFSALLVVSTTARWNTRERLLEGCARILERLGAALEHVAQGHGIPADPQGKRSARIRQAFAGLALLAGSADRQWRRAQTSGCEPPCHGLLVLVGQVAQNTNAMVRLARHSHALRESSAVRCGLHTASLALRASAAHLAGGPAPDFSALHTAVEACSANHEMALLAGTMHLLEQDIGQLCASPTLHRH